MSDQKKDPEKTHSVKVSLQSLQTLVGCFQTVREVNSPAPKSSSAACAKAGAVQNQQKDPEGLRTSRKVDVQQTYAESLQTVLKMNAQQKEREILQTARKLKSPEPRKALEACAKARQNHQKDAERLQTPKKANAQQKDAASIQTPIKINVSVPEVASKCLDKSVSIPPSDSLGETSEGSAETGVVETQARAELGTSSRIEPSCSTLRPCGLKLVVFDFDCTLTSFHVFASLSGSVGGLTLPPPYALTEKGQVERLSELDADPSWGPGVFALKAFGGPKRLEQLQTLLEVLRSSSVECIVLSKGMTQVIRKFLEQVKLLSFFSRIIGSEGCVMGCTDYDHEIASRSGSSRETLSVKGDMQGVIKCKADKLQQLMEERRLHFDQTVFVDDDEKEIGEARRVCQTVHVSTSTGIQAKDVNAITILRSNADAGCSSSFQVPRNEKKKFLW